MLAPALHVPSTHCRFTGELARTAGSVLAIDFMENLIEQNKANNGHRKNVQFM
jgi:phosphoethanolamine N-methyltransferase